MTGPRLDWQTIVIHTALAVLHAAALAAPFILLWRWMV